MVAQASSQGRKLPIQVQGEFSVPVKELEISYKMGFNGLHIVIMVKLVLVDAKPACRQYGGTLSLLVTGTQNCEDHRWKADDDTVLAFDKKTKRNCGAEDGAEARTLQYLLQDLPSECHVYLQQEHGVSALQIPGLANLIRSTVRVLLIYLLFVITAYNICAFDSIELSRERSGIRGSALVVFLIIIIVIIIIRALRAKHKESWRPDRAASPVTRTRFCAVGFGMRVYVWILLLPRVVAAAGRDCHVEENGTRFTLKDGTQTCANYHWRDGKTVVASENQSNASIVRKWGKSSISFYSCQGNVMYKGKCSGSTLNCSYPCPAVLQLNTKSPAKERSPSNLGAGFGGSTAVVIVLCIAVLIL
ncbi:hypothetical protein AOLI_G00043170 [Acnodon oligacanthus]